MWIWLQRQVERCAGAGIQRVDPHLRSALVRREHSALRPAAKVLGGADEAQPEDGPQAAQTSRLSVWLPR